MRYTRTELMLDPSRATDYTPDFTRAVTMRRIRSAVDFILTRFNKMSSTSKSMISKSMFAEHLGQTQNPLSFYLKYKLVNQANGGFYQPDKHIAKTYTLNVSGLKFLMGKLGYTEAQIASESFIEELQLLAYEKVYVEAIAAVKNGTVKFNDKSHRLWHVLQNIPSASRDKIFSDIGYSHSYDTVAASPTLLTQNARKLGMKKELPALEKYIQDRTSIREELSSRTGATIKQIKAVINAMLAGGRLGKEYKFGFTEPVPYATTVILNHNKDHIQSLKTSEFIIAFKKDLSELWKFYGTKVERTYKLSPTTGKLRKQKLSSGDKWEIYYKLERQVLDSVSKYIGKKNSTITEVSQNIGLYTIHDGFYTNAKLDTNEMTTYINSETGFNIEIEYTYKKPTK